MFHLCSFFCLLQRLRQLLKATPKWGPAHKVPKFDLESAPSGKTVTNPGFAGSSQNPFETRIWAPEPSTKLKRKPGKTNGHSQQVWSENKGNYFTLNKWNPRAKEVTSHNIGIGRQRELLHTTCDISNRIYFTIHNWIQKLLCSQQLESESKWNYFSQQWELESKGNYFRVNN